MACMMADGSEPVVSIVPLKILQKIFMSCLRSDIVKVCIFATQMSLNLEMGFPFKETPTNCGFGGCEARHGIRYTHRWMLGLVKLIILRAAVKAALGLLCDGVGANHHFM